MNEELQRQLDRLVDGELTAHEYSQLVKSLEINPQGWKSCALAFLQAQAFKKDLGAMAQDVAPAKAVVTRRPAASPKSWTTWSALAASLMLMFLLGRGSYGPASWSPPAENRIATSPLPQPEPSATSKPSLNNPGKLTLVVDEPGSGKREVDIPYYDGADVDPATVFSQSQGVPLDVQQSLRNMGYDVSLNKHYVPLKHSDGRQFLVPVDRLHASPKERPVY